MNYCKETGMVNMHGSNVDTDWLVTSVVIIKGCPLTPWSYFMELNGCVKDACEKF